MTPFNLVHRLEVGTMLDAMLPRECHDIDLDADAFTVGVEEARQLVGLQICHQQEYDAGRHNADLRTVFYQTDNTARIGAFIQKRGLSVYLLKEALGDTKYCED